MNFMESNFPEANDGEFVTSDSPGSEFESGKISIWHNIGLKDLFPYT